MPEAMTSLFEPTDSTRKVSEDMESRMRAVTSLFLEAPPPDCQDGEKSVSPRVYTEICLVVARCLDGRSTGEIPADEIKRQLSSDARREVSAQDGGLTRGGVPSTRHLLSIEGQYERYWVDDAQERRWYCKGPTVYEIGQVTERAHGRTKNHDSPALLAEAARRRVEENASLAEISTVFRPEQEEGTGQRASAQQGPGRPAEPGNPNGEQPRRAIVTKNPSCASRLQSVSVGAKRRFQGVGASTMGSTGRGRFPTKRGDAEAGLRIKMLPKERTEALKSRTPAGSYPRIAIPEELYNVAVEWRPVLTESEPLAAIFQLNLMSFRRDEDYSYSADCTNIPIYHKRVFGSFGLLPQVAWNRGLNAGMLLELYRREVDSLFDYTGWHEGKSRVIKNHGIPGDIIHKTKEVMLSPEEYGDWSVLIDGRKANSRDWSAPMRRERAEKVKDQNPAIAPPVAAERIQKYLNGQPQTTFSHGGHGYFREEKIDDALQKVAGTVSEEERRDQELRKLFWIRRFPQPLYAFCDRFPRLKADYHNQAMNLPSEILRSMYTDRDYELDLSKAHLASYVPVAKRENLQVPVLEEWLQANLEGEIDLWTELAASIDTGIFSDERARRKAIKRSYAAVYGSSRHNLLHQIYLEYGKLTGHYPSEGHDPLRPLLDHELMGELLSTRDKLELIIKRQGGLRDADGRPIPLSAWDEVKSEENRWRGVMAYVNASYEQKLMAAAFDEARKEANRDPRPRFKIWLYQSDGFTCRMSSKASHSEQINRLQDAVADKAKELGVPTELEVDYAG